MMRFLLVALCLLLFACNGEEKEKPIISKGELKNPLIEHNKNQAKLEAELIEKYINRHSWKTIESGTGLHYMNYEDGYGAQAESGMVAVIKYELSLIDGTVVSRSEEGETESFLIGEDNVESGLHEGVTYMKVGGKTKMVIPSHLAHGLVGNQKNIPPRATIIYDVELVALK